MNHSFKTRTLHLLLLSVLVFLVFANTLGNSFVWDDFLFVTYGNGYKDFNLETIFLSLANGLEYLPIRDVSYALDFQLWGNNPTGFHLSNVI